MNKLEQLQEKITDDYKTYREKALSVDKETLFNNSYYNAICGEWECYLEIWFGDGNDYDGFEEYTINVLLGLKNIFEILVDYVGCFDSANFNQEAFWDYLYDFAKERR